LTTFSELGLASDIIKALDEEGYSTPTPIQTQAIPPVLGGKDLLGIAQTGTGKTAAFALPILHRLALDRKPAPRRGCRVLVLSPTRELATQIGESFRAYGRHLGLRVAVVFGGVAHKPQRDALARGVDVLVATPGRLIDHTEERNAVLDATEVLVLDEADQMLDLGFLKPIRRIVSQLSARRQSLFFSATMPPEIGKLAAEMLRDPVRVSVAPAATTVERVSQRVIHVEHTRKRALLVELFGDPALSRALVFTRTKRGADRVAHHLEGAGIGVAAIHGNKSQRQREQALQRFRDSGIRVLVATDIAARGIDIDAVSHVVNYELPDVPEAYVHRIGRTARAGASGVAISLVDVDERPQLRDIERVTRQTIPSEDRRNDASLAVDATAKAGARQRRGPAQRRGNGDHHPSRGARDATARATHSSNGHSRDHSEHGHNGAGSGRNRSGVRETRRSRNDAWQARAARHEDFRNGGSDGKHGSRDDGVLDGASLSGVGFMGRPRPHGCEPAIRSAEHRGRNGGGGKSGNAAGNGAKRWRRRAGKRHAERT